MVSGVDQVTCLYCERCASVTITSELRGVLAHYPSCDTHIELVAYRVRGDKAAGPLHARPRPAPADVIDAEPHQPIPGVSQQLPSTVNPQ